MLQLRGSRFKAPTEQRSFRLHRETLERLDQPSRGARAAAECGCAAPARRGAQDRASSARRISLGLRRSEATRARRTRLYVWQVLSTARAEGDAGAEEIEAHQAEQEEAERLERERWRRAQQVLGEARPRRALQLRDRPTAAAGGHDAIHISEGGPTGASDEEVLNWATAQGRVILNNDVRHLATLVRAWQASGVTHPGVILTSDSRMPRARATIGRYVEALEPLFRRHLADDALGNHVLWLEPS